MKYNYILLNINVYMNSVDFVILPTSHDF